MTDHTTEKDRKWVLPCRAELASIGTTYECVLPADHNGWHQAQPQEDFVQGVLFAMTWLPRSYDDKDN